MDFKKNTPLAPLTSYKIGGVATHYATPQTEAQFLDAVTFAKEKSLNYFILGRGSNILISDSGFDGLVIDTRHFNRISLTDKGLEVESGSLLTKLVLSAVEANLAGLEDLAGIPGTVGGGILMNAGAYDQTISDHLTSVRWLDVKAGEIKESQKNELTFGYRTSFFRENQALILSAVFSPQIGNSEKLKLKINEIQERRRLKQPLNYPSCGSVFKRPLGNYAGALIESVGLKGKSFGGAQISTKHSNFIVNLGSAKAEDVREIISLARKTVYKEFEILLEPEVIFLGDFEKPLWSKKD